MWKPLSACHISPYVSSSITIFICPHLFKHYIFSEYSIDLLIYSIVIYDIPDFLQLYIIQHKTFLSLNFIILTQFHCTSLISLKVRNTELKVRLFLPVELPDNLSKHNCVNLSVGISEVPQVTLFFAMTVFKNSLLFQEHFGVIKEFCMGLELNFHKLILNFKFWQLTHLGKGISCCLWSRKIFWHLPRKTDLSWYCICILITQENNSVCKKKSGQEVYSSFQQKDKR